MNTIVKYYRDPWSPHTWSVKVIHRAARVVESRWHDAPSLAAAFKAAKADAGLVSTVNPLFKRINSWSKQDCLNDLAREHAQMVQDQRALQYPF